MADVDLGEFARRMDGALEALKREFSGLRTGRAAATLLEPLTVEAYGSAMPINQVGTIGVPEPRLLTVQVWDRGMVKAPYFIQFVFGVLGGIGADPDNLTHMKHIADKLFGDDYAFSVLAAGRHQIPLATMAALMGGHVRVGLEDSLMSARGVLAKSNAEQVAKIRRIVEELGREIAAPDDARALLGLKGADRTAF